MSFIVTYAQASFVAAGNVIQSIPLFQAIDNDVGITTQIEEVTLQDPGTAAAETFPPVGQVWAMQFAGAGPLSAPEIVALNAVVAGFMVASYQLTSLQKIITAPSGGTALQSRRINAAGTAGEWYTPITNLEELVTGTAAPLQVPRRNAGDTDFEWVTIAGGGGEANTTSNAGATGTGLALAKIGVDLPIAKIDGVNGISESLIANVMTLDGAELLPRDGTRAMTNTLDMGGQSITNVGNVDGRNVSADGATLTSHVGNSLVHVPALGAALQVLRVNSGATATEWSTPAGGGDVVGPAGGVVDNELPFYSGTTGKLIKGLGVTISAITGRFTVPSGMFGHGSNSLGDNPFYISKQSASFQDDIPALQISTSGGGGTSGALMDVHVGTRNPQSNVSVDNGAIYLRNSGALSSIFLKTQDGTNTNWSEVYHAPAASILRTITPIRNGTVQSSAIFRSVNKTYVNGFRLTYSSGATTTVTIEGGDCTDDSGVYLMTYAGASLTLIAGNLDGGSPAATTTYHVWLFGKSEGTESDTVVKFSTSASAPTMPGGYDIKRRIGSVRSKTSTTWYPWAQAGNSNSRHVYWLDPTDAAPYVLVSGGTQTAFSATAISQAPQTASELYVTAANLAASILYLAHGQYSAMATRGTTRYQNSAGGDATVLTVIMNPNNGTGSPTINYKVSASSTTVCAIGFMEYI